MMIACNNGPKHGTFVYISKSEAIDGKRLTNFNGHRSDYEKLTLPKGGRTEDFADYVLIKRGENFFSAMYEPLSSDAVTH